jgi:hypothetical protein
MKRAFTVFTIKSVFFFLMLVFVASCASTPTITYDEWISSFPEGFNKQIAVAVAAMNAYHAITDTPIMELQTDESVRRIGTLVTDARDKYRHWQSYGPYKVPLSNFDSVEFESGIMYRKGSTNYQGVIMTSRGLSIFRGECGDERNWVLKSPFDAICKGDRIADIPRLIDKISNAK